MGTVRLYATLRQRAGGQRDVAVPWEAANSVRDIIERLIALRPELRGHILDDEGCLQRHVIVFVDGRDVRYLDGLETSVDGETEISIFPPVAGGGDARI